ncbi:MAG: heterotetrameric sarcosine oxidase alpha subunit [Cryomorphaceae bacterium]|jgi:heterotetrameric sarcosine oxidase alpha subunit
MSAKRLANGGLVDRNAPIDFTWDGMSLSAFEGDTLASALMANNQTILSRSFKYHRPRGIMSCGVEESGAIVTLGQGDRQDPNVKATTQELFDGLLARGQNAWPNVRHDVGAINGAFSRFLSAGFYYKTFMGIPPFESGRGTGMWMRYEKIIRKAAGMGRASREPDPDEYEHGHLYCDLMVVGSGPAGLAAAQTAAELGLDVLLLEQDFVLGGDFLAHGTQESNTKLKQRLSALEALGVRIMTRTSAFGLYDNGTAGLLERVSDHLVKPLAYQPRQRFWTVRALQTILATGAIERHIAFHNNDRPGIMTAAAARSYLNRFAILGGDKIVIASNNDSAFVTAFDLAAAGASVKVCDARSAISALATKTLAASDIQLSLNSVPLAAQGSRKISNIEMASQSSSGTKSIGSHQSDQLLVSGGWSPVVNLISHRGVRPIWDGVNACFVANDEFQGIRTAGSASALWGTQECEASGERAAMQAAHALGKTISQSREALISNNAWETPIEPVYEVKIEGRTSKSFVDFQHDVTSEDVRLAHREGFVSVEHLKRYTTLGMATDGGKMGNIIGLAIMAEALGKEIPEVGTTVFRPPYTPISIGALSGRSVAEHFRPLRRTPLHQWNLSHAATMTMAGLWHRPWYFARDGETISEAYIREAATVRKTVGLCDVTSLGKIAVQGPDATEFLNRIYTNPFAKLPIGKARYGIMLRDDGIVMDDGTTWRLSETDYFMTTTTVNAGRVMAWLEQLLQTRWADLRVHISSVSEQWAGCAIAGPKSRLVLEHCVQESAVVSNAALPFMGVIETTLQGGIPCRIARISFSGEMAFETYVPSDYATQMMDLLAEQAESLGGCLYGLEALGTLRIEKGHVTGAELDGRVTIDDAGLGKMASAKKAFIGSVLRQRPELLKQDRPRLVGIFPKDKDKKFNAGSILCTADQVSGLGEGWITGVTHSPELGHWIGIGFISGGHQAWQGKTAIAADPVRSAQLEVEIVSPHMVDPSGERMHG